MSIVCALLRASGKSLPLSTKEDAMTSQSLMPEGESVSPYLRMALRESPKPLTDPPRVEEPQAPKTAPGDGEKSSEQPDALREVPPLARPGIKL